MAKRKVLKITPILVTLNIIVLLIIVGFYLFRLVKYYRLENGPKENVEVRLVDRLIQTQSYLDLTKGLVLDKKTNTYTFKGNSDNNYLEYSGILFRIISIDSNNNIKMVSDKSLTLMYSGLEKGFDSSYIKKWLNKSDKDNTGVFEKIFYNNTLLTNTTFCDDKIDDIENISCNTKNSNSKITLLTLNDYKDAGGSKSYLNNKESYYLSNINSSNENYYVNDNGEVGINTITTRIYGVRPVITIKSNTILLGGNGSKDKPYKIENHEITNLASTYVGDIINIDGVNFKVVEKEEETVKVVSNDVFKINNESIEVPFNKTNNEYSNNNELYKYLNTKYLDTLSIKDRIVSSNWYIGKLTLDNLDYTSVYENKSNGKVGMLTLGDLFVNDVKNIFTLSRGIEDDTIINIINDSGNIYGDLISNYHYVRPSFNLNGNINIISGIGTEDGPYEIGDINE